MLCEGPFGVALNRGRAIGIGPATKLSEARASAGVLHLPPGAVSLTQAARRSARTSSAWSADAIERSRTGRRRRREGETRVMEEGEEEACGQSPKNRFTITFLAELWLSLSSYSPSVGYYHCLSPRPLALLFYFSNSSSPNPSLSNATLLRPIFYYTPGGRFSCTYCFVWRFQKEEKNC